MSPALRGLILATLAGYAFQFLTGGRFNSLFGLASERFLEGHWVWQPFTYLFLHGDFFHLLLNLLALWMFGLPVESQWGSREFLKYYFLCGAGAGLVHVALAPHSQVPVIGASGAVFGLLAAFAMLYPDAVVYLYAFFPVKAKHMAVLFGLIELVTGMSDRGSGIARFAHLGGLVVGWFYLRWWWVLRMRAASLWRGLLRPGPPAARAPRPSGGPRAWSPDEEMAEVDRILDKILERGESSLTEDERDVLRRHGSRRGGHA
jgi:membrane associated rhomboid family serine protease